MILQERGILTMSKLLLNLDLVIAGLLNLFLNCDGEEARKMDVSGF